MNEHVSGSSYRKRPARAESACLGPSAWMCVGVYGLHETVSKNRKAHSSLVGQKLRGIFGEKTDEIELKEKVTVQNAGQEISVLCTF